MKKYILSPTAYESLEELAQDTRWSVDFDRCLRFLDVAVERGEAVEVGKDGSDSHYKELGWHPLDVMVSSVRLG